MDAGLLGGIGCRAHSLHDQQFAELKANLDKVAAVGTRVYISEYDLGIADDQQQRNVMEQQFTLFYEHPSVAVPYGAISWGGSGVPIPGSRTTPAAIARPWIV